MSEEFLIPMQRIEGAILSLRGHKVMLDADLAGVYGVETGALVRQMKRNIERFLSDFMFQPSTSEWANARSAFIRGNEK